MRYCVVIFLLAHLVGCSRENKNQTDQKEKSGDGNDVNHGAQLFESGFLAFADTLSLDTLRSGLISSFDIYNEKNNKIAHIDAEELAEFNFDYFMPALNRMLEKRGFKLNVRAAEDVEKSNEIFINEKGIKLYTKEELDNGKFWESASKNFFEEINRQLDSKRVGEAFYLLYEGNDLHVLLLTVDQHRIIAQRYKDDAKEVPHLP